jgi:hypothetical protein
VPPCFDEYLLPLGPPTNFSPPVHEKSKPVEGQVGYYTYLAQPGARQQNYFATTSRSFNASVSRFSMRRMPGNLVTLAALLTRSILFATSRKSLLMMVPMNV